MILIKLYNLINFLLLPVYVLIIFIRIVKKKDNWQSFKQRFGFTSAKRLSGKLIWLHAASIGESTVAITLVEALSAKYPEYNFLVTTGTLSSANILEKSLPRRAIHQFTPIDNFLIVRKFLKHWQPDLGIFIESELWPCLITEASKKCTMVLVNARLSDNSYRRWQSKKQLFKFIIGNFKAVLVQSKTDLYKYQQLGCSNPINLGNLKFANKKLSVDKQRLKSLKNLFGDKKIFVAASTHKEDEDIIFQIIADFKKDKVDYFPIIVLRHPERRDEISAECRKLGLKFSIRSSNQLPLVDDDLFIVDSFGELGLFYSLAFIVFVGGSFKQGGHNLVEPAYFDNVILFGPDMSNCQNIADEMIEKQAVIQIKNAGELALKIKFFLESANRKEANKYRKNALGFVSDYPETLGKYLQEIDGFMR